jgi:hypothetical protein
MYDNLVLHSKNTVLLCLIKLNKAEWNKSSIQKEVMNSNRPLTILTLALPHSNIFVKVIHARFFL